MDDISKINEGFIGFFDWLRVNESTIVGIRICYFEDLVYNTFLIQQSFVNSTFGNKCMEILFNGNEYDFDLSGDQDFTNNYVYKSENGECVFTFRLDYLTKEEINSLIKYCEVINL